MQCSRHLTNMIHYFDRIYITASHCSIRRLRRWSTGFSNIRRYDAVEQSFEIIGILSYCIGSHDIIHFPMF